MRTIGYKAIVIILLIHPSLFAQPAFDVTSVKPYVEFSRKTSIISCTGGHFQGLDVYLGYVAKWAYDIELFQLSGLPEWATVKGTFYDIEGKGPSGSDKQCRIMVQRLLADRFGLVAHLQTTSARVFALHVAKGGTRLKRVAQQDESVNGPGFTVNGEPMYMLAPELTGWTMEQLAGALSLVRISGLEYRVVDQTGLEGAYKVSLSFTRVGIDGRAPDIRTALAEQLGLRLDVASVPVEMLVVDRVRKPDPN